MGWRRRREGKGKEDDSKNERKEMMRAKEEMRKMKRKGMNGWWLGWYYATKRKLREMVKGNK